MRQLGESDAAFEWISGGQAAAGQGWHATGGFPPGFEACARILHALHDDLAVTEPGLTWDAEARSQPLPPDDGTAGARILREFMGLKTPFGTSAHRGRLVRVRWSELARRLDVSWHAELQLGDFSRCFPGGCWPRSLSGPQEGELDEESAAGLVDVLRRFTGDEPCFFRWWFLAAGAPLADGAHGDRLVEARLDEFALLRDLPRHHSPNWWWPASRAWCVSTDYDAHDTLVAGSRALVEALLAEPRLEALAIPVPPRRLRP